MICTFACLRYQSLRPLPVQTLFADVLHPPGTDIDIPWSNYGEVMVCDLGVTFAKFLMLFVLLLNLS